MSASNQSCAADARSEALVVKLARFYSVVGRGPEEPGALALMAEFLTQSATDEQIDLALTRCARECRYPVRLPDMLQRIQGQEIPQLEAEGRKAWEVVTSFVDKWIRSDVEGNYVIDGGARSSEPPKLAQQILDTVRRTGGWRAYKRMTNEDFPFQQKRFFQEFKAWAAVEQIPSGKLLTEMPRLRLVAQSMDPPGRDGQTKAAKLVGAPGFRAKPIPAQLTDAQLRDRREMLRQQAAALTKDAKR